MPDDPIGGTPASPAAGTNPDPEDVLDPNDPVALEDEDDEELYDAQGKPLPWANSKRFRKIYQEAKKGREVNSVLAESGLSPAELRSALGELNEFRGAYQEWQAAKSQGQTTGEEDAEAKELRQREQAIVKRLKEMGFLTKEEVEAQRREMQQQGQMAQVASGHRTYLANLLKSEGLISADMDDDDVDEVMAEWDTKVGRRISKIREDVSAFQHGDKRVVAKHFKAALEAGRKRGSSPSPKARPNIEGLPRRVGLSAVPKSRGAAAEKEPTSIREAAAQMFKEMTGK